jgi:hypothetical protein
VPRRITEDPDPFDGAEKDVVKRQNQFVTWRSQVARCQRVDKDVFDTEFLRIQHVAGLLTGSAHELNRERFDTITENPDDSGRWYWKTVVEVFHDLNTQYETVDLAQGAKQTFDDLYMTNKPYPNFLAEFNILATKAGKTGEQKVEALHIKVSQELSNEITHRVDRPGDSDFKQWAELYQKIWSNLEEQKHVDKLRNARPGNRYRQNNSSPQPQQHPRIEAARAEPADSGDPMILDATRRGSRPNRQECRERDLCFYCRKPGHIALQCAEKRQADARWGGWANQVSSGNNRNIQQQNLRQYSPSANYQRSGLPVMRGGLLGNNFANPRALVPFNRLRNLETGFIEGETSSINSQSPSIQGTPDSTCSWEPCVWSLATVSSNSRTSMIACFCR